MELQQQLTQPAVCRVLMLLGVPEQIDRDLRQVRRVLHVYEAEWFGNDSVSATDQEFPPRDRTGCRHSWGGMVIIAAADCAAAKIRHLVYLAGFKFASRLIIYDSEMIPNSIIYPI
nr:hypothetical protein [Nevskia sp.]